MAFYCKKVCGDGSFSIEQWNKDFRMCNDLGIEGDERNKILHPDMFPCETQCDDCACIVGEQMGKTKELIKKLNLCQKMQLYGQS